MMVPVIADRGTSFGGAFAYYCHDKNASTTERIAWTQCLNLMTDCVEKAWKRMAYTAMHQMELKRASGQRMTGAKMQKPVFCYSLSWHPEQQPSQQSMMEAVLKTLQLLGLADHQAIVAAHRDQLHSHVHVVVNAVHPITGLIAKLKHTKRKLSKFALNHERKEGKVYCPQREINHAKQDAGQKVKHCDPVIAEAWQNSSSGAEFGAILLKHGYQLAMGRRLVIVDLHGNVINPVRQLGIKTKDLLERIRDLDAIGLPGVEAAVAQSGTVGTKVSGWRGPKLLPAKLQALELDISKAKAELRQSGLLAKWFGLNAYRRRKIAKMRQQFRGAAMLNIRRPQVDIERTPSPLADVSGV